MLALLVGLDGGSVGIGIRVRVGRGGYAVEPLRALVVAVAEPDGLVDPVAIAGRDALFSWRAPGASDTRQR